MTDVVWNSNGVLQPFRQLGWWRWMYHLSPYTYLVEALMGNGERYLIGAVFTIILSTRIIFRAWWATNQLLGCRIFDRPSTFWYDVLAIHGSIHRSCRRVPCRSKRYLGLPVLPVQDYG